MKIVKRDMEDCQTVCVLNPAGESSLDLEPGAPFNDVEMSQMIGISRTPVREAVIQLSENPESLRYSPEGCVLR